MRTIYTNGAVYTGALPLCEAFVQENGRFLYAGGTEEAMTYRTAETRVVDLDKRFVCPGFNDSHMHLVNFGYSLQAADLSRHTSSLAEVQEELRRFLRLRQLQPRRFPRLRRSSRLRLLHPGNTPSDGS